MPSAPITRPLTIQAAAAQVGVSPSTVQWWISKGYLRAVRVGRRSYVREIDLLDCEYEQRRKEQARPGGARRNGGRHAGTLRA